MDIFETHCHLNDDQLYGRIDEIIDRARQAGVSKLLVVGWDYESSLKAIKIAEEYDFCYAAVGIHPENIYGVDETSLIDTLELSKHPKVVAIGEIGLDYHWTKEPEKRELQKHFFIKQIKYANEHNLPIIIHNREAFEDCLNILENNKPVASGTMHCYSGSVELLKNVLDLGLYIGLDGPVTFKNAKTPKEVADVVPLDRLLLETDCPYLTPHPFRGSLNEPVNIRLVLDEIAAIKGLSKKHIAEVTFDNACKLFRINK